MRSMSEEAAIRPKVIKNEADYTQALRRVDELIEADPGTSEGDELELWAILIEAYEAENQPVPPPDAVEAIRFRMDQLGLRPVDLAPYLGGRGRVSEILNRKRTLTIAMMVTLSQELGIPLESLVPRQRSGRSGSAERDGTLPRPAAPERTRKGRKPSNDG